MRKSVYILLFRFDEFHDCVKMYATSGKLWLKMRRMSIISHVLHFFGSSLRLKRRTDLILRVLYTPDVVDYFSYPQHGQQVRFFR